MPHVDIGSVVLAYEVRGEGAATVLVHGMAMTGADWGSTEGLGGRVVTYDRRGYGGSGAPEPYTRTTVNEQAEDLAALIEALDAAPALLVGADFGALVVLDVLLRHPHAARAAVLIEPPLHQFDPEATERLSTERLALEEALRDGGPEEAVARWLGDGADAERVERAKRSARGFFADYGGLASLPITRGELKRLNVALAVVGGSDPLLRYAPAAKEFPDWRAAVKELAEGLG